MNRVGLIFLLVVGAIVYFFMTDYGARLTDKYWAKFVQRPAILLELDSVAADTHRSWFERTYAPGDFICERKRLKLGDIDCHGEISEFNGVIARRIQFYFKDDFLYNIQLTLKGRDHALLIDYLERKYGQPRMIEGRRDVYGSPIVVWDIRSGIVSTSREAKKDTESTMQWYSVKAVWEGAF